MTDVTPYILETIRSRAHHLRRLKFDRSYCEGWMRAYISNRRWEIPDEVWMRELDAILNGAEREPEPEVQPQATQIERVRPVYPIDAWDGTVVREFAKLCSADNNV